MSTSPEVHPSDPAETLPSRKRLGDLLIESGLVTAQDLEAAIKEAQKANLSVGHILVRQGKLTREQLGELLSQQLNVKYVSLAKVQIDKSLLNLLPEEFIRDAKVLPIFKESGKLVVAMVDPTNRQVLDELTYLTGVRPTPVLTTSLEFMEVYNRLFGSSFGTNSLLKEITSQKELLPGDSLSNTELMQLQMEDEVNQQSNLLIKLVNSVIDEGIDREASDIHIEPRGKKMVVRYRIDGILKTVLDIPHNMESSLITRIKVISKMDIAEHRQPQDGRFARTYKNLEYNFRVNTMPVGSGREKVVIRILRPEKSIKDFVDLGFSPDEVHLIESLYKSPHGIVLVCGPTGSGKTTTLYTILSKINEEIRNISTIEDPIELVIEGLNQSQVNTKVGYTFSSSLRALMRQDPDVIMVGEIRDYDTLEAAIHASLTGHLVFSTIHSNSAAATVTRLVEMGAAPSLISTSFVGIIAQRLIRLLCPYCSTPYPATEQEKKMLFPFDTDKHKSDVILHAKKGCEACGMSGYSGRKGLYEILVLDREIRYMISEGKDPLVIEDAAVSNGMKTLTMQGRDLVVEGKTSLEEVIRVVGLPVTGH